MLGVGMGITGMGFNWITLEPAWRTMQAWQDKHAAFRASFEDDNAFLINKMTNAANDQIKGAANFALKVAKKRIDAAVGRKLNKLV